MSSDALNLLMRGYLNQDWQYEAPTPEGVVERFCAEVDPRTLEQARDDLHELLRTSSDTELEQTTFGELGMAISPEHFSLTLRQWLQRVEVILSYGLSRTGG